MILGNAKLILELGNSETRCHVKIGRDSKGRIRQEKFTLSNRFATLPANYKVPSNYDSNSTSIFALDGMAYANGELVLKEFQGNYLRPSALEKKYIQITSKLSFVTAMLKAYQAVSKLLNASDMSGHEITWDLFVLLPPSDCNDTGREEIIKMLRSIKKVKYLYPSQELNFKLGKIEVYPEGFAAFVGAVFDDTLDTRSGYEKYLEGTNLVLDIGAGTTDVLLIQDGELLDMSRDTFDTGGNNVTSKLQRIIRENHGFKPVEDVAELAVRTGVLKDGASEKDVTPSVIDAKRVVADMLTSQIKEYFESMSISIRTIKGMLVCGGGALGGENGSEIPPMSVVLVEYLKALAPNIEIIPMPKIKVEDRDSKIIEVELSPRQLNVIGTSILSDMEE